VTRAPDEGAVCVDDGDCDGGKAPYCVDTACYDGSVGDPCAFHADCAGLYCSTFEDTCQTGEAGSPCAQNTDCKGNCNLVTHLCKPVV
jgi:hypothetical protein